MSNATYRCEYTFSKPWGHDRHVWTCIGAAGAVHLHITDHGLRHGHDQFIGGIEVHYRTPPEHMANKAPSQDQCWLLKCPCWHDGSSMQATDFWIPFWKSDPHNHDAIFNWLEGESDNRFEGIGFLQRVDEVTK